MSLDLEGLDAGDRRGRLSRRSVTAFLSLSWTARVLLLCALALGLFSLWPASAAAESVFSPMRAFVAKQSWVPYPVRVEQGVLYEITLRPLDADADLYLFRGGDLLVSSTALGLEVETLRWRADASGVVTAWVYGYGDDTGFEIVAATVDDGPVRRVGLQVGHWRNWEAGPPLSNNHGARGGGKTEAEVNLAIARHTAALLEARGYIVDILPTVIPSGYKADAVVAIHADGSSNLNARGFFTDRPARAPANGPEARLSKAIDQEYAAATGLRYVYRSTVNTRYYYGYNRVDRQTPMVLIETGFLTSAADRTVIVDQPELSALGIANGIDRFFGRR